MVTCGYRKEYIMDGEAIFKLAQKKTPPPDTFSLQEMSLFTTARNIYKSYSDGVISLEQAQAEKAQVIRLFNDIVRKERDADEKRAQIFRIADELCEALTSGRTVSHTHMGTTCCYTIKGVIARYSPENGWTYSLELVGTSSKERAGCLLYARLEDTEVIS